MQKINFKNLPDTSTPLNASTLNQMQDNIETAINSIELSGGGDEVGTVKMFSGSTAPQGWLICDGSAISRSEYAELFSAIGTTYGSGNGTTTFNIPNIKGRTVVGLDGNDTDFDTLGETGGSKELQKHSHGVTVGYTGSGSSHFYFTNNSGDGYLSTEEAGTGNSGNLQPYIVLNYIIKASATTTTQGQIIDSLSGDSTTDAPSVHAVKEGLKRTYSTVQEFVVGTYYDDKPVYRKTVFISSLPNSQQQGYAHNIPNIDNIVDINAIAYSNSGVASRLPYLGINDTLNIGVFVSSTEVTFLTNADRSSWNSYVDLYYTKTTD